MLIKTRAFARAGLVGNPSDGFFGKTISFVIRNFHAEVILYETPEIEILPNLRDHSTFSSIDSLADDVRLFGYYGGVRLLKATIKRFHDHCQENGIQLPARNFTARYSSNVPNRVGMAGSSAIVVACLRALMAFYQVQIPRAVQANIALEVETQELSIPAGLQDRVSVVYEGLVYMDFEKEHMQNRGFGRYTELDPRILPPLYIAYRADLSEGTEVFHNDIRGRFNRGEPEVVEAMEFWAGLADEVRECLEKRQPEKIGPLLNANFDRRRAIYKISDENIRMVEAARSAGASAKFTGSGGAIVGTYEDDAMFQRLEKALGDIGVIVLKPIILPENES